MLKKLIVTNVTCHKCHKMFNHIQGLWCKENAPFLIRLTVFRGVRTVRSYVRSNEPPLSKLWHFMVKTMALSCRKCLKRW